MIGQFIRLYFTVWTAEFKSLFKVKLHLPLFVIRDMINILLTSFSWSVL